ncbi:hypothetical protein ACJJTC_006147 [Scirpophaga incertulas]
MMKIRESIDSISIRLTRVERRLDVLEQQREGTSVSIANLERTVAELKTQLNARDQEGLLADIDISCLPEEKNENTLQAVTVLAGRLGVRGACGNDACVWRRWCASAPSGGAPGASPYARRTVALRASHSHCRGRCSSRQRNGTFPFRSAADLERVFGPRPTP